MQITIVHVIRNKNEIIKHINVIVKIIIKKDYSWNPSTCICENKKYLKKVADTSLTECDEIVIVMDNLSTKKTNTIAINVTCTASIY